MPTNIVQGVPTDIVQSGLLQRVFHDMLVSTFIYRLEGTAEKWDANLGANLVMTRPGPIPVDVTPVTGKDLNPTTFSYEQWQIFADQFGNRVDTDMLTSEISLASTYLRNVKQLGVNAAQTLNHLARNKLYTAYLGGNTVTTAVVSSSVSVPVASINGFTQVTVVQSGKPLPVPVSSTNKLPIVINPGSSQTLANVIAAAPTDPNVPLGPGTLTLDASVSIAAARTTVYATTRPRVMRPGTATSVDGITSSSTLTTTMLFAAVKYLQNRNVPPCADGTYHVHITPDAAAQLASQDANFRQLYQSLPDTTVFRDGAIGQMFGMRFYQDTENPNPGNVGVLVSTGSFAKFGPEINAEVVNEGNVTIARAIIIGGQSLYEKWIDESKFLTEAGYTGKVGEFAVVNNGISLITDRIRLILRSPIDAKQQVVSSSWTWSGDFAIPSDVLGMNSNGSQFRRCIVLEHAANSQDF